MITFDRSFPLEGIEVLSRGKGGDGRTVEAYAAVFDVPTVVDDQHGHYREVIHRAAFNRTLNGGAASRALVLYNHGRSVVDGKPDSLAQVPLGSPVEITADARGLRTVSRYNKSALADSVLEAIKNDDIRAQSFRGGIYRSDPNGKVPRVRAGGELPVVTRMELGLTDYGPTPTPYYTGASIVAVRSVSEVASIIADLSEDERQELIRALATTRGSVPESATATSHREPGAEDPRDFAHSGRLKLLRLRAESAFAGVSHGDEAV
jgi:HK97 family phage prohead protease